MMQKEACTSINAICLCKNVQKMSLSLPKMYNKGPLPIPKCTRTSSDTSAHDNTSIHVNFYHNAMPSAHLLIVVDTLKHQSHIGQLQAGNFSNCHSKCQCQQVNNAVSWQRFANTGDVKSHPRSGRPKVTHKAGSIHCVNIPASMQMVHTYVIE